MVITRIAQNLRVNIKIVRRFLIALHNCNLQFIAVTFRYRILSSSFTITVSNRHLTLLRNLYPYCFVGISYTFYLTNFFIVTVYKYRITGSLVRIKSPCVIVCCFSVFAPQCNRCANWNLCITLNAADATDRSNSIIHIRILNAIDLNADDLNAVIIEVFTSLIRIFQCNHKGAEAGGLKGQGSVGISKDIQNLHIAIRGLVEHFQRVGSCTFHFRQFVQTGDGNGSNITLGRLHRVALGVLGGDLQAQNGHHFPQAVLVALIEALHIIITHVDDAEAMGGRGQVFHLHRQGCGFRVTFLVLVGSRGLGSQIHRHGVLVHQILVIHVLFLIGAHGTVLPCGVDVHGGGLVVQNVAGGVGEVQAHPVAKLVQCVPVVKLPQFALGVPVGGGVLDVAAVVRDGLCPGHSLNEVQVPQNLTVPGQILALRHIVDLCLSGNVLQVKGVQLLQPEAVDHHILQLFDLVAGNDHFVIRLFHHVVLAGPLGLGAGAGVGTGAGAGVVLNDGAPLCFLNVGAAVEVVLAALTFCGPGGFLLAAFHRPGGNFVPAETGSFVVRIGCHAVIYGPGGLLMNLRIDQTLRCKHRHKAGADDRKRQTKRKNALHQPIFFSVMIFPHSGALPAS